MSFFLFLVHLRKIKISYKYCYCCSSRHSQRTHCYCYRRCCGCCCCSGCRPCHYRGWPLMPMRLNCCYCRWWLNVHLVRPYCWSSGAGAARRTCSDPDRLRRTARHCSSCYNSVLAGRLYFGVRGIKQQSINSHERNQSLEVLPCSSCRIGFVFYFFVLASNLLI